MALPKATLPTKEIDIDGHMVTIYALTRADVFALNTPQYKDNPDSAEAFIISKGTHEDLQAVTEWRKNTDVTTVGKLVDAIIYLSGLRTEDDTDPK